MSGVLRFKVVLLGEGRVGKTSILLRYVKGEYSDKQVSTLQASYLERRLALGDGRSAQLSIWDTAGQERFHALGPIYYRDADGALLVYTRRRHSVQAALDLICDVGHYHTIYRYDITDYESFSKVRKWVRELRQIVGAEICIAIAGNKADLEKQRAVPEDEALTYAESVGAAHWYTSAKQNRGLEEVFSGLSRNMADRRRARQPQPLGGGRPGSRKSIVLVDDTPPPATAPGAAKKQQCC